MSKWNFRWLVKVRICDWIAHKVALNMIFQKYSQTLNYIWTLRAICAQPMEKSSNL